MLSASLNKTFPSFLVYLVKVECDKTVKSYNTVINPYFNMFLFSSDGGGMALTLDLMLLFSSDGNGMALTLDLICCYFPVMAVGWH